MINNQATGSGKLTSMPVIITKCKACGVECMKGDEGLLLDEQPVSVYHINSKRVRDQDGGEPELYIEHGVTCIARGGGGS